MKRERLTIFIITSDTPGPYRKKLWVPQLKMITASFLMAIFLYLPFRVLDQLIFQTTHTVELILFTLITSTIGMCVYICFGLIFDIRELYMVKNIANKVGGWKKTLAKTEEVLLETGVQGEDV